MYSQAYVSTDGSSASVAPCDRVDWKLKLGKQGGGRAILERLPALTAPMRHARRNSAGVYYGRWTHVSPAGGDLAGGRREQALHVAQQMPLPLTISCSSKSRLVLTSWFYLSGTCSPRWSRTYSRRAVKRLCVCMCNMKAFFDKKPSCC